MSKRKWMILGIIAMLAALAACGPAGDGGYVAALEELPPVDYAEMAVEKEEILEEILEEDEPQGYEDEYEANAGPWAFANFADIRQPLHLAYYVGHGEIALAHIEFMNDNLYSRTPFTYREKRAAAWLVEELLAMGHDWENIYVQEFGWEDVADTARVFGRAWRDIGMMADEDAQGGQLREVRLSQNIVLTVPGQSERKIVVGAHYDTVPYPGASDNASGTALLLESAQRMLHEDNYHTIVYVFFGAEEVGLLGADYFLRSLGDAARDMVFMVNADVLIEGPYLVFGAGYTTAVFDSSVENPWMWTRRNLEARANEITARVDEIAAGLAEAHGALLISYPSYIFSTTDHLVFLWEGHTVVNLAGWHRGEDGGFMGRVLHSPRDDFHYIDARWPGKMETNMRYFSKFLEGMLLARY